MFYHLQIRRPQLPAYSQYEDLESGCSVPPESLSAPRRYLGRGKRGSGNWKTEFKMLSHPSGPGQAESNTRTEFSPPPRTAASTMELQSSLLGTERHPAPGGPCTHALGKLLLNSTHLANSLRCKAHSVFHDSRSSFPVPAF